MGPVLLWMLIQLAALVLAALRIPLAAKYPQPAESLAVHVLMAAQIGSSALLFPYLMRDWRTVLALMSTTWPFLAAAAALSAVEMTRTAVAAAYVSAWLLGLALWRVALDDDRPSRQMFGVAVAACLAMGGASLFYLRLEFAFVDTIVGESGGHFTALTPLVAGLRQLTPHDPRAADWIVPAAVCVTALVVNLTRHRRRARLSTGRTPEAGARPR